MYLIGDSEQSFVFAFSWLGGFCNDRCLENKYQLWDHKSFTIHGLWSQNRYQPRIFGKFDFSLIAKDTELADKLMNYMPPQSKDHQGQVFLWDHEWADTKLKGDGHGHDYGHYHVSVHPDKYKDLSLEQRNVEVQKAYFRKIVQFYESFPDVQKIESSKLTLSKLVSIFKRKPSQMTISCMQNTKKDKNKGCRIKEVVVCSILNENEEIIPITCEGRSTKSDQNIEDSKAVFLLYDWGTSSRTERVTQYDSALKSHLQNSIEQNNKPQASFKSEMVINLEETQDHDSENKYSIRKEKSYIWSPESDEDETQTDSSSDSSQTL